MPFDKLLAFTKKVADFSDKPSGTPAEIKAQFDAAPDELRQKFNDLIDALIRTTDGDSGAKNLGATAITGLTGTDVQSLIESLKSLSDKKADTGGTGFHIERCSGVFFTNGGSNSATAAVNFAIPFVNPPAVMPGDMYQSQAFGDVILHPYIYNVTTTGFSVKINAADNANLGTVGSPGNIFMNFLAFGN